MFQRMLLDQHISFDRAHLHQNKKGRWLGEDWRLTINGRAEVLDRGDGRSSGV
jgi:hypothetical protein